MSSFVRRFTQDPGNDTLTNVESINVLDLDPPAALQGVGTGTVLLVGEFENGPFNYTLEVDTPDNLQRQFGALGYIYGNIGANNPSAIARRADFAANPEFWNGNSFVQINGKQFSRLLCCRVNTSVGSVQLTRLPFVTSSTSQLTYTLSSGQHLDLDVGVGTQTATFTGTAATVTGTAATFGSIVSGWQATFGIDGAPNFTVTFQTGDTTIANVVARINQFAGFTFASNSGGQLALTGRQQGNTAQVRVVGDNESGAVLTALGLAAGTTLGTGNVGNIQAVTQNEVQAIVQAAVSNTSVQFDSQSRIRISNTSPSTAPYVLVVNTTTATGLGFAIPTGTAVTNPGLIGTQQGQALVVSAPMTFTLATNDSVTLGIDGYPNVTVVFQSTDSTSALVVTRINNAFATAGIPAVAFADGATHIYLQSLLQNNSASNVRVIGASSGAVLTKLGFVVGTTVGAPVLVGSLPAGTQVQVPGGQVFVLMQDVNFTANGVFVGGISTAGGGVSVQPNGPFVVPIRHALDDGSGTSAGAGTISQFTGYPPDVYSFSVTNLVPTTAALTESQIDAAYAAVLTAAGASTLDINSVAKQTNIIISARQSNTVRSQLRTNAITASANGCFGRMAVVRPPLNTDKFTAQGSVAPGVQATSDQRVVYAYIGSNVFVQAIATRGIAGNPAGTTYTAFTVDGNIDVGSDSLMASIMSQLAPEENPGQDTAFADIVNGIERGANVQGFQMSDYIAFKSAGIAALRIDDGLASFQSGVTSVNPGVFPQLVNIARRRMADYIQDSIAIRGKAYGKKLNTLQRRRAFAGEIKGFLEGLLSRKNPQFQRINGYTLDPLSANSTQTLQQGIYRLRIRVQTLSSLDSIVLETTIGNQVSVLETLPQAA